MRVAMDDGTDLAYFVSDHLSSTSIVLSDTGTLLSEQRYKPFGEVRTDVGTVITETDFGYTGQRNLSGVGLMDYNARFYSPLLGRFIQPDTIIPNPGDSQAWNRYSYVKNNPILFMDPTGHMPEGECPFHDPGCEGIPPDDGDGGGGRGGGNGGDGGSEGGGGGQPGNIDNDVSDRPTTLCEEKPWHTGCMEEIVHTCFELREGMWPLNGWREVNCSWSWFPKEKSRFELDERGYLALGGFVVDGIGIIADGATIVGAFFGPVGWLAGAEFQAIASISEAAWMSFMATYGKNEDIYYYVQTEQLDAQSSLPIIGFASSIEGIRTNAEILGEYWVPHDTWTETWDGSTPPDP